MSNPILVPLDILDHNYTRVFPVSTEIAEVFSYKTAMFNQRTKQMKFSTASCIDQSGVFLTGLIPHLQQSLPKLTFDIRDNRVFPDVSFNVPELMDPGTGKPRDLRTYQIDYLVEALKRKRMIFDSETGSGKTTMIALVAATLDLPTLIIAPNLSVMWQLQGELSLMLPKFTFVTTKDRNWMEAKFLIGLSATLCKLSPESLRQYKVVLCDEAHTSAADRTMQTILATNAPYRFGFTADSKGRSDNRDMIVWGLLGEPIKLIDRRELEEQGYSPTVIVDFNRGWFEGDYHIMEDLLIVNNRKRNELIARLAADHGNSTILILVQRVEHGKILQTMIPNSLFVWGETKDTERDQIRKDMREGKIRVLIASKVFALGIDIPNLEVGINASGGKAEILTGQRLGRMMRTWHDIVKKWIDIFDDYHPKLAAHSKERLLVYKRKQTRINYIGFSPRKKEMLDALDQDAVIDERDSD